MQRRGEGKWMNEARSQSDAAWIPIMNERMNEWNQSTPPCPVFCPFFFFDPRITWDRPLNPTPMTPDACSWTKLPCWARLPGSLKRWIPVPIISLSSNYHTLISSVDLEADRQIDVWHGTRLMGVPCHRTMCTMWHGPVATWLGPSSSDMVLQQPTWRSTGCHQLLSAYQ